MRFLKGKISERIEERPRWEVKEVDYVRAIIPGNVLKRLTTLLGLCLLLLANPFPTHAAEKVPRTYTGVYQKLEQILDTELSKSNRLDSTSITSRPLISVDLLAANSNRGPALLRPDALETVRLSLDRFRGIGIQSVKFALQYPLLRPGFPHASEYLEFYKQVVKEAHARGIKVMPHVTVLFADTPFSPFQGIYKGIDIGRFKREYREMVHLVVSELHPDFLALLTEPDTHARLTGLRELNEPGTVADIIRFALQGLDRGKTLVGAGSGSWSSPAFAKTLAEQTEIDSICIHVYPITGSMLSNVREMARIAHTNRKQVFVDEGWLYKTLKPGGGDNVAATADVFRQDIFSFWQPLDQKFISMMLRVAETERIGLVSFFWSHQLFAYLDYSPKLERLPYRELNQLYTQAVFQNMLQGKLSGVGEHLQRIIAGAER